MSGLATFAGVFCAACAIVLGGATVLASLLPLTPEPASSEVRALVGLVAGIGTVGAGCSALVVALMPGPPS